MKINFAEKPEGQMQVTSSEQALQKDSQDSFQIPPWVLLMCTDEIFY